MRLSVLLFVMPTMAQTYQSSFEAVTAPELAAPAPADLAEGDYQIVNAHSAKLLSAMHTARGTFAIQDDVGPPWTLTRSKGGYVIARGELELSPGDGLVTLSKTPATWDIRQTGDCYVILSGGAALENANWRNYAGNWARLARYTGGSNQEWRIVPAGESAGGILRRGPARFLRNGRRREIRTGATAGHFANSFRALEEGFEYRFAVSDPEAQKLIVGRELDYDSAEVSGLPGWSFYYRGWLSTTPGANGVLAMRSSWLPGPVVVTVIGEGANEPMHLEPGDTSRDTLAYAEAWVNRGTHHLAIGPAVEPGLTEQARRDLVRGWIMEGLGFLMPLLDQSKPLAQEVDELKPSNDYERQLVAALQISFRQ